MLERAYAHLDVFEAIFAAVLAYMGRIPELTVHRDVNTRRQGLSGAYCATNIENCIGIPETGQG